MIYCKMYALFKAIYIYIYIYIYISLRVFGLLSSSLLLFSQRFGRYILRPSSGVCLSNSGTSTELRTTSFIEFTGVTCSDSVSNNRVQVLSILVLLLACIKSKQATLVDIKTIVRKPLMIKINKLRLRNLDN